MKCSAWLTVAIGAILLMDVPARAVIKVEMTVAKVFDQSKSVVIGAVVRVNPDNRVVEVKVTEIAKGPAASAGREAVGSVGSMFRVQLVGPSGGPASLADMIARLTAAAAGGGLPGEQGQRGQPGTGQSPASQPAVLFISKDRGGGGQPVAVLHLADTWLLAELVPNTSPTASPAWRVGQVYDLKNCFPGRTAALAAIVREFKAGKSTLLDESDVDFFRTARTIGKLAATKAGSILAANITGRPAQGREGSRPDLIVWADGKFRLFVAGGRDYEDVSEKWGGPWSSASPLSAAGDVNGDGHVDLLLGDKLLINDGKKLAPARQEFQLGDGAGQGPPLLASALVDATGADHKRLDAVFVLANGKVVVFENPGPGSTDKPWAAHAARAAHAAADRTLWKPPVTCEWAAIGNWGDDGRPAVLALCQGRIFRHPLDADGGEVADFARLTGASADVEKQSLPGLPGQPGQPGANAHGPNFHAARIDVNGDGRDDLLICWEAAPAAPAAPPAPAAATAPVDVEGAGKGPQPITQPTTEGTLMLINRGFGAFLVSQSAGAALPNSAVPDKAESPRFKLPPGCVWAAASLGGDGPQPSGHGGGQSLLVLAPDGQLTEIENVAPRPGGAGETP